jgi:hypothetical protein
VPAEARQVTVGANQGFSGAANPGSDLGAAVRDFAHEQAQNYKAERQAEAEGIQDAREAALDDNRQDMYRSALAVEEDEAGDAPDVAVPQEVDWSEETEPWGDEEFDGEEEFEGEEDALPLFTLFEDVESADELSEIVGGNPDAIVGQDSNGNVITLQDVYDAEDIRAAELIEEQDALEEADAALEALEADSVPDEEIFNYLDAAVASPEGEEFVVGWRESWRGTTECPRRPCRWPRS